MSKKIFNLSVFIVSLLFLSSFTGCKDPNPDPIPDTKYYINLSESSLKYDYYSAVKTLTVSTNVEIADFSFFVSDVWCSCEIDSANSSAGSYVLKIATWNNENPADRETVIALKGPKVTKNILVKQSGRSVNTDGLADPVQVKPLSASVSPAAQSGEGIEKSIDGDYTTIYHSAYNGSTLPVTLTYNFENAAFIDYIVYYPRSSGVNGIFKRVEIKAWDKNGQNQDLGSFIMPGTSSAARIDLPTLKGVTKIVMQVIESKGASTAEENRYASCGEMEFYGEDPDMFDYTPYFTDVSCSELKPEITQEDIDKIKEDFFRQLADEIFNGQYNLEFRTQRYKAYPDVAIDAKNNKTALYGQRDNPTGIFAQKDDEIIILADVPAGVSPALFLQDPEKGINGVSFPLSRGINRIKASSSGLLYVLYYTQTGSEAPLRLNIVTGSINGYFDNSIHGKSDWKRLIDAATFRHFDLKGKYATMTFETDAYRSNVPDGKALIDLYDLLVYDEQDFIGLVKYNKMFRNRAHFQVVYGDAFMYASSYHTGYNAYTQAEILNVDKLTGKGMNYSESVWGPAHELGHVHQTRPGMKWVGMAEVTNNIHSAYIQSKWTGKCRLQEEDLGGGMNRYQKAFAEVLDAHISYMEHDDHFCKLIPFWQLKLYMIDALGKIDFYKDIYEWVRTSPDLNNGACQIQFVEFACKSANLDLTDFFTDWGFLTPLNLTLDDYGTDNHRVTQQMIDDAKARIAAKNYPKPVRDFTRITDNNKLTYR
jgi:hypothetical protein